MVEGQYFPQHIPGSTWLRQHANCIYPDDCTTFHTPHPSTMRRCLIGKCAVQPAATTDAATVVDIPGLSGPSLTDSLLTPHLSFGCICIVAHVCIFFNSRGLGSYGHIKGPAQAGTASTRFGHGQTNRVRWNATSPPHEQGKKPAETRTRRYKHGQKERQFLLQQCQLEE